MLRRMPSDGRACGGKKKKRLRKDITKIAAHGLMRFLLCLFIFLLTTFLVNVIVSMTNKVVKMTRSYVITERQKRKDCRNVHEKIVKKLGG